MLYSVKRIVVDKVIEYQDRLLSMYPLWQFFLVAAVVYLLLDIARHGPLFRSFFAHFNGIFYRHRTLGKLLGVQYFRTDQWSTNRADTFIHVSPIFRLFSKANFRLGNRNDIGELKARQRQFTRPIDITPYFRKFVGKSITLVELEEMLIDTWVDELSEVYNVPLAISKEDYAARMKLLRRIFQLFLNDIGAAIPFCIKNFFAILNIRKMFEGMTTPEITIMSTPFLTTIDSSILNFVVSPEPVPCFILSFDP